MRYLHTMLRVLDLPAALRFFIEGLGMVESRRKDDAAGRYTLVFLRAADDTQAEGPELELTHNWDQVEPYTQGRNMGHVAFATPDIYAACARLQALGYVIHRPPRDGRMAFVRSPDGISVELLQAGERLPVAEPWASMANTGTW